MTSNINPQLESLASCLYRVAVKALIVEDGKLLLVKETGDDFWSVPGGGIDHGETETEALVRELKEELGLEPEQITFENQVRLVVAGPVFEGIPRVNLFYEVSVPKGLQFTGEESEAFGWFDAEELPHIGFLAPSTGGEELMPKLVEILRSRG